MQHGESNKYISKYIIYKRKIKEVKIKDERYRGQDLRKDLVDTYGDLKS